MFDNLTQRLTDIFARLSGRGKLSEADVDAAMREVRVALLEADVNIKVVRDFTARVRERCVGSEVTESLTPGQTVVKIVLEEMTALMGGGESRLALSGRVPNVVMLVGLQGSGKTTATAKVANMLRKQGRRPLMVACDVYRPAAIDQLEVLGRELEIPVYRGEGTDAVAIASAGIKSAIAEMRDTVLIDTAGRLHVDEEMMDEVARIKAAVKPDQILMVLDAMTGQDAVNAATAFAEKVDFDAVVLTKLDGDARGGAALSVRAVTGKPILYAGVGEKLDALEPFRPDSMARRILGMGDVVSLIEKAQAVTDETTAAEMEQRLRKSEFTLDDFLIQMQQLKKMGSLDEIIGLIPGLGGADRAALKDAKLDPKEMDRTAAIIQSMTAQERRKPSVISGARRVRIAAGSGTSVQQVNQLLKQFAQAQKVMKQMTKSRGRFGGMKMPPMGM